MFQKKSNLEVKMKFWWALLVWRRDRFSIAFMAALAFGLPIFEILLTGTFSLFFITLMLLVVLSFFAVRGTWKRLKSQNFFQHLQDSEDDNIKTKMYALHSAWQLNQNIAIIALLACIGQLYMILTIPEPTIFNTMASTIAWLGYFAFQQVDGTARILIDQLSAEGRG